MHVLQVVERGARRCQHVAAAVVPPVLLEAEALAGAGHELPQAVRGGPRARVGLEGALDHGQQGELERHAALLDFLDDVVQVGDRAAENAFEVLRVVGEEGELHVDLARVDVLELEAGADAIEDVGILFRRQAGDGARGVFGLGAGFDGTSTTWKSRAVRKSAGDHRRLRPVPAWRLGCAGLATGLWWSRGCGWAAGAGAGVRPRPR